MKFKVLILAAALATLAACGKHEEAISSASAASTPEQLRAEQLARAADNQKLQNQLEQNRSTAMANIQRNVATYFSLNPRFSPASDWSVIPHTDDYIDASCLAGSGWGWANVMNVKIKDDKGQPTKIKVFCSTSSASLGCYVENDFKAGPHAKEASVCNPTLPSPLKPISG